MVHVRRCVYQALIKGMGPLQGNLMPLKMRYIYIHYIFHDTTLYQLHFDIDKSCTDLSRTLIKGMGPLQSNLMTLKVMCI